LSSFRRSLVTPVDPVAPVAPENNTNQNSTGQKTLVEQLTAEKTEEATANQGQEKENSNHRRLTQ
jgi:hypothetical protein